MPAIIMKGKGIKKTGEKKRKKEKEKEGKENIWIKCDACQRQELIRVGFYPFAHMQLLRSVLIP